MCLPAQSQNQGGDTERPDVKAGELDRAIEGQPPSSRTNICSTVQGEALQEPYKMTFIRLLMCMFLPHEGDMRLSVACSPLVQPVIAA